MEKPSYEELEAKVLALQEKIDADQVMHEAELTAKDNALIYSENRAVAYLAALRAMRTLSEKAEDF